MGRYRWVFFDLFDTLCTVDEAVYYAGKRTAAEAAGLDYDAFMAAWSATSQDASVGKLKTPYARAEQALARLGVSDRRAAAEVARLDVETIQACVCYYEGAQDAMRILRERGFSLGLISNATATTAFAIGPLGLRDSLDTLVFSYEVGATKPEAAIYQAALRRADSTPRSALFVGDGANRELDAARELGLDTLCMDHPVKAHSFRNPETVSDPSHPQVHSFAELLALPNLQEPASNA
jgi:putative hydrolase of the HAD superfamily